MAGESRAHGFTVTTLAAPQSGVALHGEPAHALWVGARWQDDAADTAVAIHELASPPEWLIVDHYGIDERWETALRPSVRRIFVIDDLADRPHDCDVLVDQNLVAGVESRYTDKVGKECATLLGPRYALLQPLYAQLHDSVAPRAGPVRRLCIYFGSADQRNLTELALHAFLNLGRADIHADVVVSGDAAQAERLRSAAQDRRNVQVHAQLPSLAPLTAGADLAIGAAGSTSWERLCLGLPALVVTLADNQKAVAQALRSGGVLFVHRFGAPLNAHEHLPLCMLDGVVAQGRQGLVFRGAEVDEACVERVQAAVLQRVLGLFERRGMLSRETVGVMQGWGHRGGFSVHAGERVAAQASAGRERLLRDRGLIRRWDGNTALQ